MKLFRRVVAALAVLWSVPLFAQNTNIIFEDHFTDNGNKWEMVDTTWAKYEIVNGVFEVERKNEFGNGPQRAISFDDSRDFSVECTTNCRKEDKASMYGLIFGFKDWDNSLGLLINSNGNYMCQNLYQGLNYSENWKSTAVINKKGVNKLRVVKFGKWLNYFINDVYVDRMPYEQLALPIFIMYAGDHQKIGFDDFVMKYCDKETDVALFGKDEEGKMESAWKASADTGLTAEQYISKVYGTAEGSYADFRVFEDDFSTADKNWQTGTKTDTVKQELKDSAYYFEHLNKEGYASYQKVIIERNSDYTISVGTTWMQGDGETAYGFMWGFADWKNYNIFKISAAGKYMFEPVLSDKQDWKENAAIVKKGKNVLKVVCRGAKCFFMVNDVVVDSTLRALLNGNTFGLYVEGKQKIKFDDVVISERLFIAKTGGKKVVFSEKFTPKEDNKIFYPIYTRAMMKLGMLDDGTEIYVNNNRFYFRHNNSSANSKTAEVYIDGENDFEMEATVKVEKGEKSQPLGIIWGFKDWDNMNMFLISTEGTFKCSTMMNKKEISEGWMKTKLVEAGASNTLKIHKRGTFVEYYINGEEVAVLPYCPMRGYNHGYIVFGTQTMSSDKFEIREEKTLMPPFNASNIELSDGFFGESKSFTAMSTTTGVVKTENGKCVVGNGPDTTGAKKKMNEGTRAQFEKTLTDLTKGKKNFRIDCVVEYRHESCELFSGDDQDSLYKNDKGMGIEFGGKAFMVYRNGKFSTPTKKDTSTVATNGTWIDHLTVEGMNGKLYYYINEVPVGTETMGEFKSNGLSFVVKGGGVWQWGWVDEIRIENR